MIHKELGIELGKGEHTISSVRDAMTYNSKLELSLVIRNPLDVCLAYIAKEEMCAIDAIDATKRSCELFMYVRDKWPDRIKQISKVEDSGLDESEIDMYKKCHTIYGGRFRTTKVLSMRLRRELSTFACLMGYDVRYFTTNMISHECKLIFFASLRCASMAMREHLKQFGFKHNASEFCESPNNLIAEYPGYETFTVVRNPYARLVSSWLYFKDATKIKKIPTVRLLHKYFDAYGVDIRELNFGEFIGLIYQDRTNKHWEPQVKTLPTKGVDHILRMENLGKDIFYINNILGTTKEVPEVNKMKDYDWREHYTPELLDLVYYMYKDDFTTFNYSREDGKDE